MLIDELRNSIKCQIANAKNPIMLSSFQRDSALLLHLIAPIANLPVVWFRDKLNKCAERTIQQLGLTVYSYPPADQYLIQSENTTTLVSEYSVGTARLPMLRDLVVGNGELKINEKHMAYFDYPWDLTLWGYRRCDRHPLVQRELERNIPFGPTRLFAPLYDLTDEQVVQCCDELEIICDEFEDDDIPVSAETFAMIESADWDKEASLNSFHARFGLSH